MSYNDYKQTGKSIPIKIPELTSFVHNKLDEYMYLSSSLQTQPGFNPFKQPIIFTTEEGKLVQVPENIQKDAIASWQKARNNTDGQQQPQMASFGSPSGAQEFFSQEAMGGTPLEYTSHMNHLGNTMSTNHDVQQMFDSDPNLMVRGGHREHFREGMMAAPTGPTGPIRPNGQMGTSEQAQRVVVVGRDNSTLLYIIIFLIVAGLAYYVYTNKKLNN